MAPPIIRQTIGHQEFQSWSYLLACAESRAAIVIDAGGSIEDVVAMAGGFDVQSIVLTHGHNDHWAGAAVLRKTLGVPVLIHEADVDMVGFAPDGLLEDGADLSVGNLTVSLVHTPGHTPGGTCLLVGDTVFTGDTLFPGGPGRTASPEAFRQVVHSISTRLLTLPGAMAVRPGHGEPTTIGAAKAEYDAFTARDHPADLCGDVLWTA